MKSMPKGDDERWMREALELARRGEGLTRPNPPVGAVIVRKGVSVGRGYHHRAGQPHAEALALAAAGARARGATLYVTLEPCCSFGRTPPCTEAIIRAGIRRVVVAVRDPNPRHCGRGLRILRQAGIEVGTEVGAAEGAHLIAPFAKWIATGRPLMTLKLGLSLDGKIADFRGQSQWITGAVSRRETQALRLSADAVMVGAGTVGADNPSLLPRPAHGREPFRIVLDARGRVSDAAKVLTDGAQDRTIMVTVRQCPARRRQAWLKRGAQVWILPGRQGQVDLNRLLLRLGQMGLLHVLCEGGSELAAALVRARLVDEFLFFLAPSILGGKQAVSAVGGKGWRLDTMPRLKFVESRRMGPDIMLRAVPV